VQEKKSDGPTKHFILHEKSGHCENTSHPALDAARNTYAKCAKCGASQSWPFAT
jgi:hypothetical protein